MIMKRRLPSFITGFITAAIIFSFVLNAFAAAGTVEFNTIGLMFNGQAISAVGEAYPSENGTDIPSVIIYTDEKGGGTTYLPARRVADLMGVSIGYDAPSNSVTIGGTPSSAPTALPAPEPAPAPTLAVNPDAAVTVYVTNTGSKYHRDGCRYLSKSQISIALSSAKSQGYSPCSVCNPPS